MLIYLDFETSNRSLSQVILLIKHLLYLKHFLFQLCHCCVELYKTARGEFRESVLETCQRERHIKLPGSARCTTCLQETLESISRHARQGLCKHQKLSYIKNGQGVDYELCQECLEELCKFFVCDHSKTEILAGMKPISWSAMLVETLGGDQQHLTPKIVREKTYVANNDNEDILPSLWNWLKSLRGLIYDAWRGEFVDVASCRMSEAEKLAHARAEKCYVCLEPFKTSSEGRDFDVVDFVVGGEMEEQKVKKCVKVLDHDHRSGLYRGMYLAPYAEKLPFMCKTLPH